ncbi:MAG: hypothetical protein R3A51_19795, partial [Nannocystaceae bacterium]
MPRGTALLSVVALLLLAPGCAKPAPKIDAPQPAPPQLPPDQVDASAAIEGVRVFDGERVLEDMTVLLSPDGTILELGPSQKIGIPEGVELIEGFGHTLLPGLIDAHTHVWMAEHLRMALAFGVTTELDMFTQPGLVASFKDAEAKGAADDRADLRSSGILATAPGGHGTEFGFEIPTLTRADEAAAFVDARIAEGSDYLKIVYDDGAAYGISFESLTPPVVAALVAQSHARDKLAVVHIGAEQGAVDALRAGADGLAHVFMDREPSAALLEQVRARPVFITDTLAVAHAMCDPS